MKRTNQRIDRNANTTLSKNQTGAGQGDKSETVADLKGTDVSVSFSMADRTELVAALQLTNQLSPPSERLSLPEFIKRAALCEASRTLSERGQLFDLEKNVDMAVALITMLKERLVSADCCPGKDRAGISLLASTTSERLLESFSAAFKHACAYGRWVS